MDIAKIQLRFLSILISLFTLYSLLFSLQHTTIANIQHAHIPSMFKKKPNIWIIAVVPMFFLTHSNVSVV